MRQEPASKAMEELFAKAFAEGRTPADYMATQRKKSDLELMQKELTFAATNRAYSTQEYEARYSQLTMEQTTQQTNEFLNQLHQQMKAAGGMMPGADVETLSSRSRTIYLAGLHRAAAFPVKVSDFSYDLPPELVAHVPPEDRGASRLLVLDRRTGGVVHAAIRDIARFLGPGDLAVFNDTRMFPARLLGEREPGDGAVEVLLVSRVNDERWEALVHPGQRMRPGRRLRFERGGRTLRGEVLEERFFGRRLVRFWTSDAGTVTDAIEAIGHIPLPPYIKLPDLELDRERYQTVFAREAGSIAAPTAGLHFTDQVAVPGV